MAEQTRHPGQQPPEPEGSIAQPDATPQAAPPAPEVHEAPHTTPEPEGSITRPRE
jgi:hypothetical protein